MKYLGLLFAVMCFVLTGCNNNDEPVYNTPISINESFLPVSVEYDVNDTDFRDKIKGWNNEKFVVNSADDLPDDPFGFSDSYSDINYTDNTLLLYYSVHPYDIMLYSSSMIKNNTDNTYDWTIKLGLDINNSSDDSIETLTFTRYAILIPKMQITTSDIVVYFSVNYFSTSSQFKTVE